MKGIVRSISPGMLFAFCALSTLLAHHARAQRKQAFTQDKSSTPAQCGDNQLSLQNFGEEVSMGSMRSIEFTFTNTSFSPCTLKGYPRFEFLNKYGRPATGGLAVSGVALRGLYKEPPQLVTIEPGKTARFFVEYLARYDEAREKPCPMYRRVRVTAPGTVRVFVRRFRWSAIEVCSGLGVSQVLSASDYN